MEEGTRILIKKCNWNKKNQNVVNLIYYCLRTSLEQKSGVLFFYSIDDHSRRALYNDVYIGNRCNVQIHDIEKDSKNLVLF